MESEKASSDSRITVDLVTHNYTTSINKNKAVEFSKYFSSLLSGNFSDHNFKKHQIQYDIPVEIFQTYIDWIDNAEPENYSTIYSQPEESLENVANDYDSLLKLLNTSVIFMSDKLTCQLSRIITTKWLNPDRMLDIWKFAQEHAVSPLRDVAFEACLDRFSELPDEELMKLPAEKFIELITNSNINDNQCRRKLLVSEFLNKNQDSIDPVQKQLLEIADFPTEYDSDYLSCLVTYKLNEAEKKLYCVYFLKERELVEFVDCKPMFNYLDDGYEVMGRRIVGRRFSTYVIGGEKGIGSGRFIKSIWRYCLLSRTWYYVTELCAPRRHMIAEFLDENLYLAGGVGSARVKLSSVAILNVHTNEWRKGREIPEVFTETPASCVMDGQIIYLSSTMNLLSYNPKRNQWVQTKNNSALPQSNDLSTIIQSILVRLKFRRDDFSPSKVLIKNRKYHRHIFNATFLIGLYCEGDKIFVDKANIDGNDYTVIDSFCQQVDNITPELFSYQLGYFNIINPDTLYNKISQKM